MYYYVLHVDNLVAMAIMATMYMIPFVNKLQKGENKRDTPSPIPTILITDRQMWYVCIGLQLLSPMLPFYLIFG